MTQKLSSLPVSSSNARAFSRLMLSGAMEVEIDKQGRALLPAYLREYAGVKGETVMAGVLNRVEIWNKPAWVKYSKDAEANSSNAAETLAEWEI